jgi:hypothetical protein
MNSPKSGLRHLIVIVLLVLVYFQFRHKDGTQTSSRWCFGECDQRSRVQRLYSPEQMEFAVRGPYEAMGKTLDATHVFKLRAAEVLASRSFGYDRMSWNDHGQDGRLAYLDQAALETYHRDYLNPHADCPASFMVQHLRHAILIGADEEISRKLLAYQFKIEYGGTPFVLRGHRMDYDHSLANGQAAQLRPAKVEEAYYVGTGYAHNSVEAEYFLVTGIDGLPAQELPKSDRRQPAAE